VEASPVGELGSGDAGVSDLTSRAATADGAFGAEGGGAGGSPRDAGGSFIREEEGGSSGDEDNELDMY